MGAIKDSINIIEKTEEEVDVLKSIINELDLSDEDKAATIYGLNLIVWLPKLILEQNITIHRLQELLFGKSKQKSRSKKHKSSPETEISNSDVKDKKLNGELPANGEELDSPPEPVIDESSQPSGRTGRRPHTDYDAIDHYIPNEDLKPGDLCPEKCGGKVYDFEPKVIIRINGQMHGAANRYKVDTKRCNLCGELFRPELPEYIGKEKYDAKFKAQLAVQKYYMGTPSYRQDKFQSFINVPVPHTTQWYLNEDVAGCAIPIFNLLCNLAANNNLLYYDDTYLKIVDEIRDNQLNPDKKRTGIYTTGILAKFKDHKIILNFNGTYHDGENMRDLLKKRTVKEAVILMSDALPANNPKYGDVIRCYCLSHGLRKFESLDKFYEVPCNKILGLLAEIYEIDRQTTCLTITERLNYHQRKSQPLVDELYRYLNYLLDEKLVEPNNQLGEAINYMLNHQHELTQFLRVAGAPIDNNVLEQCLKIPIRHRKNSMFYKTKYGASVGGILTSVIYTCILSGINPIEYLTMLQVNRDQIIKEPSAYLPWTYQHTLSELIAA